MMRMIIAGATGAIGIPLVKQLVADGHSVVGITRTQRGVATLTGIGAEGVVADVLDRDALLRATNGLAADAVVHELTALAKPPARHADMRATDRLRTEGTAHLLEVAGQTGAGRFVTQSMVFGYGYRDLGDTPLTEDAPFGVPQGDAFDEHLAAMRSAEQQAFEASGVDGIALRYGLFYGADAASVATMLRKRAIPVPHAGGLLPFVHHDDAAKATAAAIERGRPGQAYNIVDDTPHTFRDLLNTIAAAYDAPRPYVLPVWALRAAAPYAAAMMAGVSMRASNAKARRELAWAPEYPSIDDGIGPIAGERAAAS